MKLKMVMEWINALANEKPQPVNQSAVTGLATKYKFEVKIGSQISTTL